VIRGRKAVGLKEEVGRVTEGLPHGSSAFNFDIMRAAVGIYLAIFSRVIEFFAYARWLNFVDAAI